MADPLIQESFPLFPLELVVLPTEVVPLHIFEDRYKTMIAECLEQSSEFGVVWLAEDGLHEIGCACKIDEVIARHDDGSLDIMTSGTRPFRVIDRDGSLPYPAASVEFLADNGPPTDPELLSDARKTYEMLVQTATEKQPDPERLQQMGAYAMAATVDFGLGAKQGLLNLRSENDRLRLTSRLFRAALKRLDFVDRAQARAKSNGKVRFG